MLSIIHRVDLVTNKEFMVETKVMVVQGWVEHSLIERLPNMMIELTIMPFQSRLRPRRMMLSLHILFSFLNG